MVNEKKKLSDMQSVGFLVLIESCFLQPVSEREYCGMKGLGWGGVGKKSTSKT